MSDAEPALDVRALSLHAVAANGSERKILNSVSLTVTVGEVVGITGDSGAGKSLLALAIVGLLPPEVRVGGGVINVRGARGGHPVRPPVAMIVQDAQAVLDPMRTVGRQLRETLRGISGHTSAAAAALAVMWLGRVGLNPELARRYPHQLSGGQTQRVAVALAACVEPWLLIADEPTSALDPGNAAIVIALLRFLAEERGASVLLVSHDAACLRAADRVMRLSQGQVVLAELAPRPSFTPRPLAGPGRAALRLVDVHVRYGAISALDGVSLTLAQREAVAVMGESGSGKSTLARIAAGLRRPSDGAVWRAGRAAMIFQDATEAFDPRWQIGRSVAEPLHRLGLARGRRAVRSRVSALLRLVGLPADYEERLPFGLSGGELQRVAIARALAAEADLVICDEPTSALDSASGDALLRFLRSLQEERGFTLLLVTHDASAAALLAHRVVWLADGRLTAHASWTM